LGKKRQEKIYRDFSLELIEKAQFGREIPRKSKEIQPSLAGALAAKGAPAKEIQMIDRTEGACQL
jgi:hypothetical protein